MYAEQVTSGAVLACKWEVLACRRHLADLKRVEDSEFPYVFDETRADRIYRWYQYCRHVRGPFSGQPIELLDWQKFDHGVLYGWVHKDSGKRRFRKAFHMRARGNVKSTENSAKCNYHMCADAIYPPGQPDTAVYESMPEVECAAVDRGQARRVWNDAREMGEKSPDILRRLTIKKTYIEHNSRGGFLRPISKDTKNKDGGAPCYVSMDEYHAHSTSEIHDRMMSSFGKRSQSLMDIISTAGDNAINNPCKREYDLCVKILSGEIPAEDYFIMIRQLDEGDDPHDESLWLKANPILRVDNAYSKELYAAIKSDHDIAYASNDAEKIREFLTRRGDLWQASAQNKYMTGCMDKLKELFIPHDEFCELVKNKSAYNGLDLSKTIDLTGVAHAFRVDHPKYKYAVTSHGFIPEERAEQHEQSDRVPYRMWGNAGHVTLTPGSVVDYGYIESYIEDKETEQGWKIEELCYDPYNAEYFTQRMELNGYTRVEIRQGVQTLSEPTKKLRELILQGEIVFEENPCLLWCFSNAVEVTDNNGNIKLSKKHKDDSQRIDLLSAAINSLVRALAVEDDVNKYIMSEEFSL